MTTDVTNIWNQFHKELAGFIARTVENPADQDDILQDVFVKIIHNQNKINQAANLQQYLYGMVRNTINDYFRSQKHNRHSSEIPESLTEEEAQSLNATIADCCIKPFIHQLPGKYKEALLISEFQNMSQKDLAERLRISYSGAKSRVQRGKEKLKALILNCCAYEHDLYGNLIEGEKKSCSC